MNRKRFVLKACAASVFIALQWGAAHHALANPTGATVVSGSATIAASGNTLTVTNSPNAIINWQSFNIAAGELTNFVQQSSASAVLNRVLSSNLSSLFGTLQSNGRVFLVNPNGAVFGPGAQFNTASFTFTTSPIADSGFLSGAFTVGASQFTVTGPATIEGMWNISSTGIAGGGLTGAPDSQLILAADSINLTGNISGFSPVLSPLAVPSLIAGPSSLSVCSPEGCVGVINKNSGNTRGNIDLGNNSGISIGATTNVQAVTPTPNANFSSYPGSICLTSLGSGGCGGFTPTPVPFIVAVSNPQNSSNNVTIPLPSPVTSTVAAPNPSAGSNGANLSTPPLVTINVAVTNPPISSNNVIPPTPTLAVNQLPVPTQSINSGVKSFSPTRTTTSVTARENISIGTSSLTASANRFVSGPAISVNLGKREPTF